MGNISMTLAFVINWGWLQIGPYIHININPVIVSLGPLALRWYGLMYVVGIIAGLWFIRKYTARKGITEEQVFRVLWWCIVAGLIGGRLYFVIQQPDLIPDYLEKPWNILATWEGGMAFFGAIFAVVPVLFWRALHERVNPLVMLDAGALFAACGQIFGRIGNLINGDIIGYPSTLPWSTVYDNPNSWACLDPGTCHVPVQPAAGYELLLNLLMIAVLLLLARRYRRPGALMATYLFGYCITQFLVFFVRANIVVPLGPLDWGLKQAQWTSLIVFILLIPITFLVMRSRYAQPVPAGEVPATYGIPQKLTQQGETSNSDEKPAEEISVGEENSDEAEVNQPASVGADSSANADTGGETDTYTAEKSEG
ncbi:MAG TPA: prolipoprotein diacylglyceryl transferase [Ktedonobacteraceae bacterium]|nr:prolipoprotein diacylglyceryl transferase [Ktedonobacteraceae bacterium]